MIFLKCNKEVLEKVLENESTVKEIKKFIYNENLIIFFVMQSEDKKVLEIKINFDF